MKKRLLSLLCVLVLTVSVIPAASALEGEAARAADTLSRAEAAGITLTVRTRTQRSERSRFFMG